MDNCRISPVARGAPIPAELTVYHAGQEQCEPGHRWIGVRDHFLVHYVLSGEGVFRWRQTEYPLAAGSGFTIFPDTVADYEASRADPWRYCWVGFHGASVESALVSVGITPLSPVFTYDRDAALRECLMGCVEAYREPLGREFALRSLGYRFLYLLAQHRPPRSTNARAGYVSEAISFLNRTFSRSVTIAEVAAFVGIDRRYLAEVFRDATGRTPQEYLLGLRIAKAHQLLTETGLSVAAVAQSVGYDDPLYFSRLYRRKTGRSPSEERG